MNDLNHLTISGRLGRDPEVRFASGGMAVCSFSIASNYKYKEKETATWLNCVALGKLGEIVGERLHKGQAVLLVGRLAIREWEKDGKKNKTTEIVVSDFRTLASSPVSDVGDEKHESSKATDEDDIPF